MHSLWQLAALALLLILVLALVPQTAARLRYWLAVGTLGLMFAFPMATFCYLYEPPAAPVNENFTALAFAKMEPNVHPPFVTTTPAVTSTQSLAEQLNAFFQENAYYLLGEWFLGMAALSIRFAGSCWQVRRLRHLGT